MVQLSQFDVYADGAQSDILACNVSGLVIAFQRPKRAPAKRRRQNEKPRNSFAHSLVEHFCPGGGGPIAPLLPGRLINLHVEKQNRRAHQNMSAAVEKMPVSQKDPRTEAAAVAADGGGVTTAARLRLTNCMCAEPFSLTNRMSQARIPLRLWVDAISLSQYQATPRYWKSRGPQLLPVALRAHRDLQQPKPETCMHTFLENLTTWLRMNQEERHNNIRDLLDLLLHILKRTSNNNLKSIYLLLSVDI